ncbi:MAG: plasmid pRiA4b ORF-3 family protein [Actinobacteria bacterium]|nr:MAG: plasmid pRiA4b ORF-3 family protein [Actinomycetota bacterium]
MNVVAEGQAIDEATEPARWLLASGEGGIGLTQTGALARSVVRDAAERWPSWWNAELFGPPHREADVAVLQALHEGLRRVRLLRRRGRQLMATARGRALAWQPATLLSTLGADLGAGEPFTEEIAAAIVDALRTHEHRDHSALAAAAFARISRAPWCGPRGEPVTERDVSWVVGDVLRRGEAYGLIERDPEPGQSRFLGPHVALTPAGGIAFRAAPRPSTSVLVFDAELVNARGVRATVAVSADEHLTDLHDAIQEAFGWYDDHLYSFWLDGAFWGDENSEYTSPVVPDHGVRTADVPIEELDLAAGAKIAYVFDFGDEWRVRLTLRQSEPPDGGPYPRVLQRVGQPPPQYPALDD